MRIAAPAFGPIALVEVRVAFAALVLAGPLLVRPERTALRRHALAIGIVGVTNSALPFVLLTYATLFLTGGFAAILNATTPMWTALFAWLWLRERISASQWLGLAVGLAGVVVLLWGKLDLRPGSTQWQATLAIAAALLAAVAYGGSANFARRRLAGVPPLAVATGSQLSAAIVLAPPCLLALPAQQPGIGAWSAAVALAVACTALAYLLYFRLLGRVGAVRAAAVTFLVPMFATVWGGIFLGEVVTLQMVAGGGLILGGTALVLGFVRGRRAR